MKQLSLLVASLSLATVMAHAEDATKASADLTFMNNKAAGSSTNTIMGHAQASRQIGVWTQEYKAEAAGVSGDSVTTPTERYLASGKLSSEIQPNTSVFGKLQLEKDRGIGLDYSGAVTVGLGHTFIKDGIQNLTGEVGVGNRMYKFKGLDSKTEIIGTLGGHYDRKLTNNLVFSQDLGYEAGSSLSTLRSLTSLSMMLSNHLSGIASYQLKRDTVDVAGGGTDSTNTQATTFGIKYVY